MDKVKGQGEFSRKKPPAWGKASPVPEARRYGGVYPLPSVALREKRGLTAHLRAKSRLRRLRSETPLLRSRRVRRDAKRPVRAGGNLFTLFGSGQTTQIFLLNLLCY